MMIRLSLLLLTLLTPAIAQADTSSSEPYAEFKIWLEGFMDSVGQGLEPRLMPDMPVCARCNLSAEVAPVQLSPDLDTATIDMAALRAGVVGESTDGRVVVFGVEPEEIQLGDITTGTGHLEGIEPDEIDIAAFPDTSSPFQGIEPDEIDIAVRSALGHTLSVGSRYGAYLLAEVVTQRDGSTVYVPRDLYVDVSL